MKRIEASAVLHEISNSCQESVLVESISLDLEQDRVPQDSEGYEIKMQCSLDGCSRERIKTILEKHQLEMKQKNGFVILQSRMKEPLPVNSPN
jgi:hypothetical protein